MRRVAGGAIVLRQCRTRPQYGREQIEIADGVHLDNDGRPLKGKNSFAKPTFAQTVDGPIMIPYSDGIPARRFPIVNTALTAINFAVWLLYGLPNGDSAISHASFYPCDVSGTYHLGVPWGVGWITAMFMHASLDHVLGHMLFLMIFGKNVEGAFGRLGYLFLFRRGFVATMTQIAMTLVFGSASDAQVPTLGASGPIAAVLGAYLVLYPNSRISTLALWWPINIPAWVFSATGSCTSSSKVITRW